jgi:glycosyltransferase involved in cell wall biosynthesis
MSKKILINGITLEGGNLTPLLLKTAFWQNLNNKITFFGTSELKEQIDALALIKNYKFLYLKNRRKSKTRTGFIIEALKKNLQSIFYLEKIKNKYDIIYTVSSVLDSILLPFFLKKIDKKIKWATVFDNTVPLIANGKIISGNKIIRVLAWFFYKISLFFLKKADVLFVVKTELQDYLLKSGFKQKQLVITGNGVQSNLIKSAKKIEQYQIDALFIGRINEAKGIFDMLEVINRVKEKYTNFQLAIMGKGDEKTEKIFKQKIKKFNLENNVQFLGYKTGQEKFDIIKSSKIFLFLSETESVPQAPLEAVCSGLKTLVYDLDAYNMYKNNEVIIFKKNDCNSVAEKIIEIFEKKDFENENGKLLLDVYSWDTISEKEYLAFNH